MNMLQYELFASVAHTLNISKTAQEYGITQPAVSHHIKSLEESLGVELTKRTKHGVYLTDAGKYFLPYVQEILAINNRAETRMRSIADGMIGRFRIAALSSSSYHVSRSLVEFYSKCVDIQVDISLMDGAEMVETLRANQHDFYYAVDTMLPDNMGFDSFTIAKDKLALFVNKNVAEKMGDSIDWELIRFCPFVSVPKSDVSLSGKIIGICGNHGFQPHIINIYNHAESVMLSVDAGLGAAILPSQLETIYHRPNVVKYELDDKQAGSVTKFIWCPDKLTTAGEKFLNAVRYLEWE